VAGLRPPCVESRPVCYRIDRWDISGDTIVDHLQPHEVFPAIIRVMVEWVEDIRGLYSPELDLETAQCLANSKVTRSCRLRPSRSTDHAMTMSNSPRVAAR
jgi:hypothetical protein